MTYQLKNLSITAIATVDEPDNPPAEILLFKRRQDSKEDKTVTKDQDKANKTFQLREGNGLMIDLTKLNLTDEQAEAAKDAFAEADKQDKEAKAELEKVQKQLADLEAEKEAKETDVQKRMSELEKQAKEDAAKVASMEDDKRTEEAEEIVRGWDHITGATVEDYAPVVKAVRASAPGKFDELKKLIDNANATIKASEAFKPAGKDAEGVADVMAKVNAKVEELRKIKPSLSRAELEAEVWDANPDLQTEYRKQGD